MAKKIIRIACDTGQFAHLTELDEFQGDLKELSTEAFERMRKEIVETGVAFATHVWKDPSDGRYKICDGHQRKRVLSHLVAQEGYTIEGGRGVPIVPVKAGSLKEAKRRVLQGTSQFGRMTGQGLYEFAVDAGFSAAEIGESFRFPEIDVPQWRSEYFDEPSPTAESEDPEIVSLAERFLVPPFSVLNAREGWWQDRKRAWLALGIKSEVGRDEKLLSDATPRKGFGSGYDTSKGENAWGGSGTSIFDPVLCEVAYRWFCPPGGQVLDPFSGGSVRGIVASKLGLKYLGVDLRGEQVIANHDQAELICKKPKPVWLQGDSQHIKKHAKGVEADFLFSCPPYADLEVYSEMPEDLSNMPYTDFREKYIKIIAESCKLLANNRFACFVIGEARDKKGHYYGLVPDTIQAFEMAGLKFYNEAILVTSVGSLPIRSGKTFEASRKLGKTHQNVLIFVKGDAKRATYACGKVDVALDLPAAAESTAGTDQ